MIAIARAVLVSCLAVRPGFAASAGTDGGFANETQAAAFVAADANGDRQLDAAEFAALIDLMAAAGRDNAVKVRRFGAYAMAFAKIDANADGVLTVAELGAGKRLAREYAGQQ